MKDFKEDINLKENKEWREANCLLNESVEVSLKAFDVFSENLQLDYNILIDRSVESKLQRLHDVGLFDRFEIKGEISMDYFTLNGRRRVELEIDEEIETNLSITEFVNAFELKSEATSNEKMREILNNLYQKQQIFSKN